MASNALPTLSTFGWVNATAEKADKLFSHFFASDALQSHVYRGNITSLPNLIQQYGNDPNAITNKMRQELSIYLGRYFDSVDVEVNYEMVDESLIKLKVYARLTEKGKEYSLGKLLEVSGNTIKQIINLNN